MDQQDLNDAGIKMTPYKYKASSTTGICYLVMIALAIGAAIVHPTTPVVMRASEF